MTAPFARPASPRRAARQEATLDPVNSCTAGRGGVHDGQHGIRSGLTKVGFTGAPIGG